MTYDKAPWKLVEQALQLNVTFMDKMFHLWEMHSFSLSIH